MTTGNYDMPEFIAENGESTVRATLETTSSRPPRSTSCSAIRSRGTTLRRFSRNAREPYDPELSPGQSQSQGRHYGGQPRPMAEPWNGSWNGMPRNPSSGHRCHSSCYLQSCYGSEGTGPSSGHRFDPDRRLHPTHRAGLRPTAATARRPKPLWCSPARKEADLGAGRDGAAAAGSAAGVLPGRPHL